MNGDCGVVRGVSGLLKCVCTGLLVGVCLTAVAGQTAGTGMAILPRLAPGGGAPIPPSSPGPESDPSDVYWDDRFTSECAVCKVNAVAADGIGNVYVGGTFSSIGGVTANNIAKWNGLVWTPLGSGVTSTVWALAVDGTDVYAGGQFPMAGGTVLNNIAKWDGSSWSALGDGIAGTVYALALRGDDLYAGGLFTLAGGLSANNIARWSGSAWSAMGTGLEGSGASVYALATRGNDIYAGGVFSTAGGISANNVARWDGASWTPMGSGIAGRVSSFAATPGFVYAGGAFPGAIAKWNGSIWSLVGTGMDWYYAPEVLALVTSGETVFAGGRFTTAGWVGTNYVARWDGSSWSALGSGIAHRFDAPAVNALGIGGNALFAGGYFETAGTKVSGNFAVWQPRVNVSNSLVTAAPGAMTIGDDIYGFYKPALMTAAETTVNYPGGLPTTVTLDRAPEIHVGGPRVNGAFTLAPEGLQFGGSGATLRVEFSEDDVTSYTGTSYTDFRAVKMTYRPDYPANKEAAAVMRISNDTAVPIRIENGRQIYAITLPITEIGSTYGAVPALLAPIPVDLALSKLSIPDTVLQGQDILYNVSVLNRGETNYGAAAHNVIVTDDLPPQVDYTFAWSSQGSVTYDNGMVTANLGTLNGGAVATLSIMANAREAGIAENMAYVSEDEPDLSPDDHIATATTTIVGINDLAIGKTATPGTVYAGGAISYHLTVTNLETSVDHTADDVVVTDTLPAGVVFSAASASQGTVLLEDGVVVARLGNLAAGTSATVDIQVTAATVGTVTNSAVVGQNGNDPNTANNSASAQTTLLPSVELALTKTASPDTVYIGIPIMYHLTVNHPDLGYGIPATNVVVTDTLPAGVEFIMASTSQGTVSHTGGVVTAQLGLMAPGPTATVDIQVRPVAVGVLTNTATASAAEMDPVPGNNSASAQATVLPPVDLALVKTATPATVNAGDTITYQLAVTNLDLWYGAAATNVVATDTLPAGVEFISASASQGTVSHAGGVVTAQLGTLAAGATATVDIQVRAVAVGTLTNTAIVGGAEMDPAPTNNSASAPATVLPVVDLAVTKTAMPDPVAQGGELRYEIEVSNLGGPLGIAIPASAVVLTDTLPEGVEYVSATSSQGSVSFTSPTLTVDIGTLITGAHASVQIVARASRIGVVENVASVTCAEPEFDASNNEARVTSTIGAASGPDLTGSWSDIRETCRVTRRGLTCTIQGVLDVTNIGNEVAGRCNVTFYISSTPSLTPGAAELRTQRIPSLRPGAHARARVRATLPAGQKAAGRYLIAFIDSASVVAEAREDNNVIVFGPIH